VCSQQVSVVKKYNIRHHYETHYGERYRGLQGQPRRDKVKELIAGLKKQQSVFTSRPDISAADVKASYKVARSAFLTPNLVNLAFFRGSWRKKNCLAFWLFLFNIWLFLEAVGTYYQTGVLAF